MCVASWSIYPGDLRNVSAADTLRRRTSSPTGHTVACLVTGRTRAGEVGGIRAYMADVTAQADLFVCADPEDAGAMVLANFSNLVSYRTSSEDGGYPSDLQGVNVTVAQWWRLQQCWKLVQEHEERHRFRYSFYMKTQPDCHRYNACYPCLDTYKAGLHKSHVQAMCKVVLHAHMSAQEVAETLKPNPQLLPAKICRRHSTSMALGWTMSSLPTATTSLVVPVEGLNGQQR